MQVLNGFLSVVVITCPSHGQGRRFDPGRKQGESFCLSAPPSPKMSKVILVVAFGQLFHQHS